jgi:hypothetical protein
MFHPMRCLRIHWHSGSLCRWLFVREDTAGLAIYCVKLQMSFLGLKTQHILQ